MSRRLSIDIELRSYVGLRFDVYFGYETDVIVHILIGLKCSKTNVHKLWNARQTQNVKLRINTTV